MAWETAEPPAPDEHETAEVGRDGQASEDVREERLGPIALARHRKDDGRLLILYRRADDREP
jgi:hypothetical protein